MKILVSILLLVLGVTTCFAQSSTPDYIQKAKVGLNQYYPQFKDYFEPIFAEYNKLRVASLNIINDKIQENLEIFEEEIATDRDKCATILTSLEILKGEKTFRNSKKQIDSKEGEYAINEVAGEIANDINNQVKKEIHKVRELQKVREETQKVREETQKVREETQKVRNRNEKLREIINFINNSTKSRENTEKIVFKMDEYFGLFEVSEIKNNSGLQNIIKEYINFNKQINRRPSAFGQKFIDEYNRITKNK